MIYAAAYLDGKGVLKIMKGNIKEKIWLTFEQSLCNLLIQYLQKVYTVNIG